MLAGIAKASPAFASVATDVDPSSSVEVAGGGDFVQEPAEDQPRDDA